MKTKQWYSYQHLILRPDYTFAIKLPYAMKNFGCFFFQNIMGRSFLNLHIDKYLLLGQETMDFPSSHIFFFHFLMFTRNKSL